MRCWDKRRAPNSQRGLPLKILIALHYDNKKGQVAKLTYRLNFLESPFRDCMKRSQVRARRLVMRRIIAAYTNASPLAQSLS